MSNIVFLPSRLPPPRVKPTRLPPRSKNPPGLAAITATSLATGLLCFGLFLFFLLHP